MNIEQAKAIPLAQILDIIGCKPDRVRNHKARYLSPLRTEKTPSFHVDYEKNLWYDFGTGEGGSIIEFACAYLKSCNEANTISDGLRWLDNMSGNAPCIKPIPFIEPVKDDPNLVVKSVKELKHPALVRYLDSRGIPLKFAAPYIVELNVHNRDSNKDFFALGFANEDDGYEIRNKFFKGCVGTKTISFIRGKQSKPDGIHIFEGFIDYVSAITYNKILQFEDDVIVLNSLSCLKQATPYIKDYGYKIAYTWLDNDVAGQNGTNSLIEFFKTQKNLQHQAMNDLYHPHKDVNAWHMNRLSLSL